MVKKEATPKKLQIRVSVAALNDIEDITSYIHLVQQQPLNAIKVGDAIFKTIDKIERSPFAYKECSEIPTKSKMYRKAVCLSWLIIYKITNHEIIILGIIQVARNPSKIKALRKRK